MRPSFEVADILRDHLDGYKARYNLSLVQQKAFQAILNCRTAVLGGHVDCCTSCGHVTAISYNSPISSGQAMSQPPLPQMPVVGPAALDPQPDGRTSAGEVFSPGLHFATGVECFGEQ